MFAKNSAMISLAGEAGYPDEIPEESGGCRKHWNPAGLAGLDSFAERAVRGTSWSWTRRALRDVL
jgi:hypothetical protein